MKYTEKYGFMKPDINEVYNVNIFNENMDKVEEEISKISDSGDEALESHTKNKSNPHGVTASQVGLWNVPNVTTNDQTPTYTVASSNTALSSGEKLSVAFGKIAKAITSLISHLSDTNNPHNVTNTQIGAAASDSPVITSSISLGRKSETVVGSNSVAVGLDVEASGAYSFAEGHLTISSKYTSHSEGYASIASANYTHAEGRETVASDVHAHAEGYKTTASGVNSHAEGVGTIASGRHSHAEGNITEASEQSCHAEGYSTKATKAHAHAEGRMTTASGVVSHAEGDTTEASGNTSHAEGSHSRALGAYSHAEGNSTYAEGDSSHAEGYMTNTYGEASHAEGYGTTAYTNQHAQGHYNSIMEANSTSGTSTGTAFVIGNGTLSTPSNAFRVTGEGKVYGKGSYNSSGADYAEYAEWADGNVNNEDRRGYFVTFDETKTKMIRIANEGDYILGIVSGNPCIVGNSDEDWLGRYVTDEFGTIIYEEIEVEEPYFDEESGETKTRLVTTTFYKQNPEYNPEREYESRESRKEWSAIGWIGVLSIRDDGSCVPGGYCKCVDGGIATSADRGLDTYKVIERVSNNVVRVVIK